MNYCLAWQTREQSIRENTAIGRCRNRAFTIGRVPVKKLRVFHVTAYENLIHDDKAPSRNMLLSRSPSLDTYITVVFLAPRDSERVI